MAWRSPTPSLRATVTVAATAVVSFALVVVVLTVSGLFRRSIAQDTEALLVERVDAVEAAITAAPLPERLESTGREVGQVQVVDDSGTVVSATTGLAVSTRFDVIAAPSVGRQTAATVSGAIIDDDPNEQYRLVARTVVALNGPLTVYAVTSLDPATRAEEALRRRLALVLPPLALATGLIVYAVVGFAFRPVETMRREVEDISAGDLSARVTPPTTDHEISRLGETLNGLLRRLETGARQQQLFAASASHELRSPLSAIRTEMEVALAYPERTDWPERARDVLVEVRRLESLSRDLRALTAPRPIDESASCDLAEIIAHEVGHRSAGRTDRADAKVIEVDLEPVTAAIGRDGATQVVRNLLDNADRHASSSILVELRRIDATIELVVANDGPPVPPGDRERIFDPFTRLDEARSSDDGGSGSGSPSSGRSCDRWAVRCTWRTPRR